jgi:predicted RNA-binding protein with PIN domain
MSDDKSEPGAVANSDDDEAVQFVARRYGLNRRDARKLVARVGNDRERLNQEARKLTRTETKAPSDNL